MCLLRHRCKNSVNSHAAARQAPAASRGSKSQCDIFSVLLAGVFLSVWVSKTIVLDGEGVPYSARLQMKCVSFLIRHLHVCLALFLAACLLHVSARFLAAGCTVHCRTGSLLFSNKEPK